MNIQRRTVDIEAASKLWKDDLSASQIAKLRREPKRYRRDRISKSRVFPGETTI
jgi:GcrA cell cycle regulator